MFSACVIPAYVHIEKPAIVHPNVMFTSSGGGAIKIHENVLIEEFVQIENPNTEILTIGSGSRIRVKARVTGTIGDNCEIGAFAVVDANIGNNVKIGSKVKVTSDIKDNTVVLNTKTLANKQPNEPDEILKKHIEYLLQVLPKYH